MLGPWKKSYDQPRQHIKKKRRRYFANKGPSSQSYGFSSNHGWVWELDHNESWVPKNWCFWIVVLEKTLVSPLDCRISNQSILKEISPESSLEGMILKLKLQYFGHLMGRTDSLEKTLMLGKTKGSKRRGHRGWDGWMVSLTWWTLVWASGDGQKSLACYSPWGWKESAMTEWLNWTDQAKKSKDFTVKHPGGKWNFLAQFIHLTH